MKTTDHDTLGPAEREFAARAGDRLRDSADRLDAATQSRLNRARQSALDGFDRPGGRLRWMPAGVMTAAAVLLAVLWWQPAPDTAVVPLMTDDMVDFELLLDDGELEMYDELEFFVWLPEDELETIG